MKRGFTLVEVLVAAFIVVMAGLGAAALFTAVGGRVRRGLAEAEAATLAAAVYDYAWQGLSAGTIQDGVPVRSQDVGSRFDYFPQQMSALRSGLVWQLLLQPHPLSAIPGHDKLHLATLSVRRDTNDNCAYDASDEEVATLVFVLSE